MSAFIIQVSHPNFHPSTKKVEYLFEAISRIFPKNTETAYLLWNLIPVRIDYKYDLYVLIDDILLLLDTLLSFERGFHHVGWGSNSFNAEWNLEWTDARVKITSQWNSVAGVYEDLLNNRSTIDIEKDVFLWEWKALLRKIIEAIDKSGIEMTNLEELDSLRRIEAAIAKQGYFYAAS